jgi:DnaJ-class molecular chaperone
MAQKDYYEILGVAKNAKIKQIKDAYRTLALRYHPDRNRDSPSAVDRMKDINEAYAVLANPRKRKEYDTLRQQFGDSAHGHFRQSYSDQDIFNGSDIHQIFEEMARAFGIRGFDEIFKDFYGPGYRTFEFKRPGFHGRGFIFSGPGAGQNPSRHLGPVSSGIGQLSRSLLERLLPKPRLRDGSHIYDRILLKPEFARRGGPYAYFHKLRAKKLVVKVPAGIRDGQQIRLAGLGHDGQAGGKPGDLFLLVKIHKSMIQKIKSLGQRLGGGWPGSKP